MFLDLYFLSKICDKIKFSFSSISNKYLGSLEVIEIDMGEYLRFLPSIAPATVPE